MAILQYSARLQHQRIASLYTASTRRTFLQDKRTAQHSLIILPLASVPVGSGQSQPLLGKRLFNPPEHLHVPDSPSKTVFLAARKSKTHIAGLRLAEVNHRTACQVVVPLISNCHLRDIRRENYHHNKKKPLPRRPMPDSPISPPKEPARLPPRG